MKELSLEHKNAIRDALSAYCDNYLSRNRAAESLNGVSAATVSTIVNSKYANISDDLFALPRRSDSVSIVGRFTKAWPSKKYPL